MAKLQHNNPCPGGNEINNFGRPFLGHYYFTLSLYEPCLGVEKKHINFTIFIPKSPPLPWAGGHEIYNFLFPNPTDPIYQIWLRLAQ